MQLRGYYRAGDFEAMHSLDLKCFSPAFQFDAETMRRAAESESAIVAIAERGPLHEMAGFIILHLQDTGARMYGYIVTLDVAPDARRGGIATLLLAHAEEQARAAGARRVALHVAVDNAGAIEFYKRSGYVRAGVARGYYREIGLDAFVYAKQLEKPMSL
jgi:ribosomal-protein-alanine N-acetyltransferase